MNKILCFGLFFLCVACRKEENPSSTPPDAENSGKLLYLKTDSLFLFGVFSGIDSIKLEYDNKGKLTFRSEDYPSGDQAKHDDFTYDRDENGRTVRISEYYQSWRNGVPQAFETKMITEVFYQPNSDKIDFLYYYDSVQTRPWADSIVFDYSGGELSATRDFQLNPTAPAKQFFSRGYAFKNGRSIVSVSFDTFNPGKEEKHTFITDGKVNPIQLGEEEALYFQWLISSDNVVNETVQPVNGEQYSITTDYTYREDGYPVKSIQNYPSRNRVRRSTYFYK